MEGHLRALAAHPASELYVLWHDGHAASMNGAKVGVLKEADQVGLGGLLQGEDSRALEAQVGLEVLRDLADEALERQLADQQFGRLLVLADFAQCYGARPEAVRLFETATCCLSTFLRAVVGGGPPGALPGGLLGTGHVGGH